MCLDGEAWKMEGCVGIGGQKDLEMVLPYNLASEEVAGCRRRGEEAKIAWPRTCCLAESNRRTQRSPPASTRQELIINNYDKMAFEVCVACRAGADLIDFLLNEILIHFITSLTLRFPSPPPPNLLPTHS